jgi:hypothetical protein
MRMLAGKRYRAKQRVNGRDGQAYDDSFGRKGIYEKRPSTKP